MMRRGPVAVRDLFRQFRRRHESQRHLLPHIQLGLLHRDLGQFSQLNIICYFGQTHVDETYCEEAFLTINASI